MSTYIDSNMREIGKFLSNVSFLKIPTNQRSYAWTDEEVQQLWLDITEALDSGRREYFLGPMVLKQNPDSLEVIDGQQRIATAYIILSVIRRALRREGDNLRADWFNNEYFGKMDIATLEIQPKFHMNEINDPFFQRYVVADSDETKIKSKMKGLLKKDSNLLLLQAITMIWDLLQERQKEIGGKEFDRDILLDIQNYLEKNVSVLFLTVTDEANAFIIFETLNDRGIGLNIMDLLKNQVVSKAQGYLDQVKSLWTNIRDNLSDIDPRERFLFHYWTSLHGRAPKSQLYHLMRDEIRSPQSALTFVKDLSESSKIYSALSIPGHPYWNSYDQRTRDNLNTLNLLDAQQALPILLAAARKFPEEEFRKLTEILVVMAIRYNLIGELRTGVLSNYYVEIPQKIQDGKIKKGAKVFRQLKPIYPSDKEFEEAFEKKALKNSQKARYLLAEIENYEHMGTYQVVDDPKKVNLEHILPKNPSQVWKNTIESLGEDLDEYTYRLGNLALVSTAVNKELAAKDFEEKKRVLFSEEKSLKYTRLVAEYSTWLKDDIEDRQRKLAQQAPKVWRIDIE